MYSQLDSLILPTKTLEGPVPVELQGYHLRLPMRSK